MTEALLVDRVREFVANPEGPADDMIESLLSAERTDISAQAAVRYMLRVGAWRSERNGGFHEAMNHLFAHYEERPAVDPTEYQATTKQIIQDNWNYECVPIVIVPRAPKPETEEKAKRKPPARKAKAYTEAEEAAEEGVSGSRTYKSINEQKKGIDTTGASERLKKVIGIQREG